MVMKIFAVFEVLEAKKVNVGTFYLTGEANNWWNTLKHKWKESELTSVKFLEGHTTQLCHTTVQR